MNGSRLSVWRLVAYVGIVVAAAVGFWRLETAINKSDDNNATNHELAQDNRRLGRENAEQTDLLREETDRAIAAECASQNQVYDVLRSIVIYATETNPVARAAILPTIPTLTCPTFTPGPARAAPPTTVPQAGSERNGGNASPPAPLLPGPDRR
jgi:hypothetical protein